MSEESFPLGIQVLDLVVGIITVSVAVLIIIGHELARILLIFALSASLLGIGMARITRAAVLKGKGMYRRVVNLLSGVVVAILAFTVIFSPALIDAQQIQFLSIAWFILGCARVVIGVLEDDVEKYLRLLQLIVGSISIVVAFLILIFPSADFLFALSILALITGMNGLSRVARGYVGV